MGLLPTYAQIGVAAPILLTLLRLAQGFAVGGEWGGATLMAVEHASRDAKGLLRRLPADGRAGRHRDRDAGVLVVSQLPDEQFLSWGWRIPFLASAVLIVIGLVIRLSLSESPDFAALRERSAWHACRLRVAFRKHWKQILLGRGRLPVPRRVRLHLRGIPGVLWHNGRQNRPHPSPFRRIRRRRWWPS